MSLSNDIRNNNKKKNLNNTKSLIKNQKALNIVMMILFSTMILSDIFYIIKENIIGISSFTNTLLIISIILEALAFIVLLTLRFNSENVMLKVITLSIFSLPIIAYIPMMVYGDGFSIILFVIRLIFIIALVLISTKGKEYRNKKSFRAKQIIYSSVAFLFFLIAFILLVSNQSRRVLYSYDNNLEGYVADDVLDGKSKVEFKEGTVKIADNSLLNAGKEITLPQSLNVVSKNAFKDSMVEDVYLNSKEIFICEALNESNVKKVYLNKSDTIINDLDKLNGNNNFRFICNKEDIDNYRKENREYDYLFIPNVSDGEYYALFNGTELPVEYHKLNDEIREKVIVSNNDRKKFKGFIDKDNNQANFPIKVTGNIEINALWLNLSLITFDYSDGNLAYNYSEWNNMPKEKYVAKEDGNFQLPILIKQGYEFVGWYDTNLYTEDAQIIISDNIVLANNIKDMSLKAKFNKKYKLSYHTNGGIIPDDEMNQEYVEGDLITPLTPSRLGFDFEGWYDNNSFDGNRIEVVSEEGTELYAKWKLKDPEIILSNDISKVYDSLNEELSITINHDLMNVDGYSCNYTWYKLDSSGVQTLSSNGSQFVKNVQNSKYYCVIKISYAGSEAEYTSDYINVNITKADYDLSSVDFSLRKYEYNGKPQFPKLDSIKSIGDGLLSIIYDYNEENITKVGSGVVTYRFTTESLNYNVPDEKEIIIQIIPKTLSINYGDTLIHTYSGTKHLPSGTLVGVISGEDVELEIEDINSINVGSYSARLFIKGNNSGNYNLKENECHYEIIKADYEYNPLFDPNSLKIEYDGKYHIPEPLNLNGIEISSETVGLKDVTNNSSIIYKFIINDPNYNNPSDYILRNIVISKKTITLEIINNELVYNGTSQNPEVKLNGIIKDEDINVLIKDNNINSGSYKIDNYEIVGLDKGNYNLDLANSNLNYEIKKAEVSIEWSNLEFIYDGNNHSPKALAKVNNSSISFTVETTGAILAGSHISKAITDANFDILANESHEFVINKKEITLDWDNNLFIYNGKIQLPKASLNGVVDGDNLSINYDYENSINVGIYIIKASIISDNYLLIGTNLEYEYLIDKASFEDNILQYINNGTIVINEETVYEYDGQAHYPDVKISGNIITSTRTPIKRQYLDSITEYGEKYISLEFYVEDSNYESYVIENLLVKINKKKISLVLDTEFEYTGDAITPDVIMNGIIDSDKDFVSIEVLNTDSIIVKEEAYILAYELQGLKSSNYEIDKDYEFYIVPKTIDITGKFVITDYVGEYDGFDHTVSVSIDPSILATPNIKTSYSDVCSGEIVRVDFISNDINYKINTSAIGYVTINKRILEISLNNDELIYNGDILRPSLNILNKAINSDDINVSITNESINSGSYKANFQLSGNDINNYSLGSYDLEYLIKPRGINVLWSNLEFTYNNISHKPTATAVNLILGDTCDISVNVLNNPVDAGINSAIAVSNNDNYYVLDATISHVFEIKKASIPYEKYGFKDITYTYDGNPHSPITNMQTQYTDYNHQINYEILNTVTNYGIGQIVNIKFSVNDNYEEITIPYNVTILKREIQLQFETLVFTYTGDANSLNITGYNGLIQGDDYNVIMNSVYSEKGEHILVENDDYIVTGLSKDNYEITGTYVVKIVVEPKSLINHIVTPYSGLYDGLSHTPEVSNLPVGVTPIFSISYTDVCDNAVVTITYDSGNQDIIYDNIDISYVTITKKPIKVSLLENSLIYNGNIQMPHVIINESDLVSGDNVEVKIITNENSINVGNYNLEIELSNSNYALSSESNLNYSINKCPVIISWSNLSIEYNNEINLPTAKALYNDNILDVLVNISANKESKYVGNYIAFASILDSNYEIDENSSINFEIIPHIVDVNWSNTAFTYDNNSHMPKANIESLGNDNPKLNISIKDNLEAIIPGTYTAICNILDSNYSVGLNGSIEFVINKGSIEEDIPSFNAISTYNYDGNIKKPTIDFVNNYYASNKELIRVRYSLNEYIKVGTYNDEITFYTESGYYNEYKVKVITEILPMELDIEFDSNTFKFNNEIQVPNVIINNLVLGDEIVVTITNNSYKVAEYIAIFNISGSDKDNYVINGKYKYNIIKGDFNLDNITYSNLEVSYNGLYNLPIINNLPDALSIDYENSIGVKYVSDTKATIRFIVDDNAINNYNIPSDLVINMKVNKAKYEVNWLITEFEYDGNTHRPTYENETIYGDIIELIFDSTDKKDRGEYIAHVSGIDNPNYELIGDLNVSYKIKEGTYDMSSISFKSIEFTYDKLSHKIAITGSLPKGADGIVVSVSYDYNNQDVIDVGEYEVIANFTGSSNYNSIPSMKAIITIVPRTIELSWTGLYTHVYDSKPYLPNALATGLLTGDTCNVIISGEAINAGSHIATVKLDNPNYELTDYTKEFIIQKADYEGMDSIQFAYTELTYNGKLQHQSVQGLDKVSGYDGSSPYIIKYEGGATNVSDGECLVTVYFGTDSENYNAPNEMTTTVSILPMVIDISVAVDGTTVSKYYSETPKKTYDAKEMAIEASYNIDDLIEGDSLELSVDIAPVVVGTHKYTILFDNSNYTTKYLNGNVTIEMLYIWWITWNNVNGIPRAYNNQIELIDYSYLDNELYYVYYDSDNNIVSNLNVSGSYTVELVNKNTDNIYINSYNSTQSFELAKWSFDGQFVNNNITYNQSAGKFKTEFEYDGITYEYGIKMESSTQIVFKVTSAGYYTFVVTPGQKIKIGNQTYTASENGSIRVYLSTGNYYITKSTTNTGLYAIIK